MAVPRGFQVKLPASPASGLELHTGKNGETATVLGPGEPQVTPTTGRWHIVA